MLEPASSTDLDTRPSTRAPGPGWPRRLTARELRLNAAAVSVMGAGVILHALDGTVIASNPAAQQLLGLTAGQLLGASAFDPDWFATDSSGRRLAAADLPVNRCAADQAPVTGFEMGIHLVDRVNWVRADARPLHDANGEFDAVVVVFDDITSTRALADGLARMESRLDMVSGSGVGLWEWDIGSEVVWHDEAFAAVTGLAVPTPAAWMSAVHPHDAVRVLAHSQAVLDGGTRHEITFRILDGTGAVRWIATTAEVPVVRDGAPRHVAGSVLDVTELQEVSKQVQQHLDCMTDGYMRLTPELTVSFVNRQAAAFMKTTGAAVEGRHIWDIYPAARGTTFEESYLQALDGTPTRFEAFYEDLAAWYEVRAHPSPDGGIAVYFRDVTDQYRSEEEHARLLADAEQAKARLAEAAGARHWVQGRSRSVEADLRAGLAAGRLVAHYQPFYDLASGAVDGSEALARFDDGSLTPDQFIPVAEHSGLIGAVGRAVLDHVVTSLRVGVAGPAQGRVWVNVSGCQLNDPDFTPGLIDWADAHGLTSRLGIEITESVLADDVVSVAARIKRLSAAGFPLAVDDFGTGFSSFARLIDYPVDMVKVDQAFIAAMDDARGIGVVAAIIDLAHALEAVASAEGVETAAQLELLRELGADKVSGYYLARPGPASAFAEAAAAGEQVLRQQ